MVIAAYHAGLDDDPGVQRLLEGRVRAVLSDEYVQREASREITEQQLLDRYASQVAGQPGPEEVRLQVIATPTEGGARNAIKQLQSGDGTLAKQLSTDSSAGSGGDVGFVTQNAD